jgi:hypothetical protein
MKATTHTELYRPFEGEFLDKPRLPLILAKSALRQAFRKKKGAFFLFVPSYLVAIITSVMIFAKNQQQKVMLKELEKRGAGPDEIAKIMERANALVGDTVDLILGAYQRLPGFIGIGTVFMILAMVWYGSGMISDDRRTGANLLYFSRPLTRYGYGLGKFLGLFTIGAIVLLMPAMLICTIAAFTSTNWLFVKEEWDMVLKLFAFCCLWIGVMSVVVLGLSSLVTRRTLALFMSLGVIFVLSALSGFHELADAPWVSLLSVFTNFSAIGAWLFDKDGARHWNPEASAWVLSLVTVGSVLLLSRGIKKMEVVG